MTPEPTTTTTAPSEASKAFGLLYALGIAAAAIFIKNPAHVGTANNIIALLNAELPTLASLL